MIDRSTRCLTWVLATAGFLSIVAGGLVTGYGAGGVASDGPQGIHHFVFLYPTDRWLGVWDVFLEHTHRLLGTIALLLGTALALILRRTDGAKGPRRTAAIVAGGLWALCFSGAMGVLSDRAEPTTIAGISGPLFLTRLHAWIAPAVFAASTLLVEQTAKKETSSTLDCRSIGSRMWWPTWIVAVAMYLLIVSGGQLRHIALDAAPWWFTLGVWLHLTVAGVVACGVVWLLVGIPTPHGSGPIVARVRLVAALFALQLVLGIFAWVTSYGWPLWFNEYVLPWEHNIVAEGDLQVIATTAHVAVASLCLAVAVSLGVEVTQTSSNQVSAEQ